jgi:hypothetical protein
LLQDLEDEAAPCGGSDGCRSAGWSIATPASRILVKGQFGERARSVKEFARRAPFMSKAHSRRSDVWKDLRRQALPERPFFRLGMRCKQGLRA